MAASTLDKLTNTASTTTSRPQPTQVTAARSAGIFTLSCNALTGWPTDTKVHFITYKITTAGAKIAGSQIDMDGIVSGTSIGSITIRGGSDVGNAIGDIVEAAPTAAWAYDLNKWGTVHADSQGNLLTAAVQTALGSGSQALNGYNALAFPFNTVTYNGNRSYTCVINTQDLTGTLSAGMRLRTQRTVSAPTQSTTLNGTNQFWSKSAPSGMTFTDNFTVSAWVKVTSYAQGYIISRFDGTNGWGLRMESTGQVTLFGIGGGAGADQGQTYQSLPLNRWVHVAATLTMSTSANIYFDGVLVPSLFTNGASTSITQAGNINIGAANGATFLTGKVAQSAIFSAVLTQSTIQSYISQGLAGTETSLISAYSFNGNANDLNVNANNLTSNNGAVATTADSPFGGQGNGTISATLDYAIVQSVSYATNTTVVVQVPEGCTISTSGGVAAVSYSSNKVPYLFPVDPSKWKLLSILKTDSVTTSNATYGSFLSGGWALNIPIGAFTVGYQAILFNGSTTELTFNLSSTSLAGLTQTQGANISRYGVTSQSPAAAVSSAPAHPRNPETLAAQTSFVMYTIGSTAGGGILGSRGVSEIYAENGYL